MFALASGCIFDPPPGDKIVVVPPSYPKPSTPAIVLENLRKSYAARDSNGYKACYEQNYFGTSIDQTDPNAKIDSLYFADEARHISSLARSTTISDVIFEMKPDIVRSTDLGDPAGWALIQNPVFKLEIDDGPTQYIIPLSSETIEFRFSPTLDTTSPTDTLWKIIRWTEVRQ